MDQRLQQVSAGRSDPSTAQYAVALSWTALQPGRSMDALLAIDQAQNFAEFRDAAALLSAPSQNLIYADTDGNIGYQLAGAVPLRRKGNGMRPSPGWDETTTGAAASPSRSCRMSTTHLAAFWLPPISR